MRSLMSVAGVAVVAVTPVRAQALQSVEPVRVTIETDAGTIIALIDLQNAPRTARNFLRYVEEGFYSGGSFYRSVRMDNQAPDDVPIEVIQGGINRDRRADVHEPITMEGTGETGLRHVDGTLSMARAGPDTARGEFFVCIGAQPELDEGGARNADSRGFAAFGQVIEGMDVVRQIHALPTVGQRFSEPVRIVRVTVDRPLDP